MAYAVVQPIVPVAVQQADMLQRIHSDVAARINELQELYKAINTQEGLPDEQKKIIGQKIEDAAKWMNTIEDGVMNATNTLLTTQAAIHGAQAGAQASRAVAQVTTVHAMVARAKPAPTSVKYQNRSLQMNNVSTKYTLKKLKQQLRTKSRLANEAKDDAGQKIQEAGLALMNLEILRAIVQKREADENNNEDLDQQIQQKERQQLQLKSDAHAQRGQKRRRFEMTDTTPMSRVTIEDADDDDEDDLFMDID
jgi:hypothetical protein